MVVYHEPRGDQGFTQQRGERLLEDNGDGSAVFEWVFFVAEQGSDFGLLGWYHLGSWSLTPRPCRQAGVCPIEILAPLPARSRHVPLKRVSGGIMPTSDNNTDTTVKVSKRAGIQLDSKGEFLRIESNRARELYVLSRRVRGEHDWTVTKKRSGRRLRPRIVQGRL